MIGLDNTLCREEFIDFYNSIVENNYMTNELTEMVAEKIGDVAAFHSIARIEVVTSGDTPITRMISTFNNGYMYNDEEATISDTYYQFEYLLNDSSHVFVKLYSKAGYTYDEGELKSVRFLVNNLFFIYQRSILQERVNNIKYYDVRTGLVNIEGLKLIMQSFYEKDELHHYTFMFMNIKGFKYINQRVGNVLGDEVMFKFTRVIANGLMADDVLARAGGDNFMLLVRKEHAEGILQTLSNIAVSIEVNGYTRTFEIQTRVGICDIKLGMKINNILDGASIAIGTTKESMLNQVWYNDEMRKKLLWEKEVSASFFTGLTLNEFVVYYQPKVRLENEALCGAEALVRWIKDGKVIPPQSFIPIIEREGTIGALDLYVFEKVCKDIRDWLDRGITPVKVSTNFSKVNLNSPALVDEIVEIMKKYDVDGKYLEVELTESSDYEDCEKTALFLKRMKVYGVSASIDDFGTGYSSLSLLNDLPVDVVKIDKSFIADEIEESYNGIVVKNIVNMINELDMKSLAEGVETQAQVEYLKRINCDMAQGFLYSKPLPHDEYEKWLVG